MADFKYTIGEDLNEVFYETNNTFLALRHIAWGDKSDFKVDIRKYYSNANTGEETMSKGVSMSDEAADELTLALVKNNFGNTHELLGELVKRTDFNGKINPDGTIEDIGNPDEGFFDTDNIFNGLEDEEG